MAKSDVEPRDPPEPDAEPSRAGAEGSQPLLPHPKPPGTGGLQ